MQQGAMGATRSAYFAAQAKLTRTEAAVAEIETRRVRQAPRRKTVWQVLMSGVACCGDVGLLEGLLMYLSMPDTHDLMREMGKLSGTPSKLERACFFFNSLFLGSIFVILKGYPLVSLLCSNFSMSKSFTILLILSTSSLE